MSRLYRRLSILCGLTLLVSPLLADDWPQFRGPGRDNISKETGLLRKWPEGGPRVLWSTEVCEGYAAGAIYAGRVYFEDYGRDAKEWYVRCLSLADGKELWRFGESKIIRPNHGITRAVPAVDGKYVFSLDPKCVFHCLDAETGRELWRKDLVQEYKTQIPSWYNGQCPLIEPDRVVIAVGGDALMVAFDKSTGNEIWRTPNPQSWPMSHSSVMPAELGGVKQYLWCMLFGPLGVRASDGALLWHHERKFNIAVAPSPLAVGTDRVFMTAGYDAGSIMVRVKDDAGRFVTERLFELSPEEWNSEVHTPILYQDHMFAVGKKKRGLFTCLDLDGKVVWDSEDKASFDLGSFILADGMFFVLDGKTGMLHLLEASTREYHELDQAQVLSGHDVWGPMALSGGKLVLRDMSKMVCIEVGGGPQQSPSASEGHPSPPVARVFYVQSPSGSEEHSSPPSRYRASRVIAGQGSGSDQFKDELRGLAIDADDRLYAVGDSKIVVFSLSGERLESWETERPGQSVAVGSDGTVYVGQEGQVQRFDRQGKLLDTWRDAERFGLVTAIGVTGDNVLLADVAGRCIRRYDKGGKFISDIGKDTHARGFLLPNRHLDLAVDRAGVIHACNPGQHRVLRFSLDGQARGQFGRFDGRDPAGFGGCCNPTNIALTPQGDVVVTEKAPPRVKVYNPDGKLLALMGQDDFDPDCKNMDIAVDSRGRIYVADTVRLRIVTYEPETTVTRPAAATQETKP